MCPRLRLRRFAGPGALAAALVIVSCGKVTPPETADGGGGRGSGGQATGSGGAAGGDGGGAGGEGSGGTVGTGGSDGGTTARCPAREPTAGAVCLRDGATCEYGTDPRGDTCRTFASCTGGRWSVTKPNPMTCPPFTDAGMCPKMAAGTACTTSDAFCSLVDGRSCHCTNCVDGPVVNCTMEYLWRCEGLNTTMGCPAAAPDIGTACVVDGVMCGYGCRMQQILSVRLATYEYRPEYQARLGQRRHLGFVIEDSPNIPAVDRDHDMVDLYGYTSMLLAATQTQREEIDDLKRQLQALKTELAALARRRGR